MANERYLEIVRDQPEQVRERPETGLLEMQRLRTAAAELVSGLVSLPASDSTRWMRQRCEVLQRTLSPLLAQLEMPSQSFPESEDWRWLHDNVRLVHALLQDLNELPKSIKKTPQARTAEGVVLPRVLVLAEAFLSNAEFQFTEESFSAFVDAFEESAVLQLGELWALAPVLKLVLLERIAELFPELNGSSGNPIGIAACVQSLCEMGETDWPEVLEPLILFDKVLRDDPAGAYAAMDLESRKQYRNAIVTLASRNDLSEMDVAIQALSLAQKAQQESHVDPRVVLRRSHIGYYLVAEGREELDRSTGFRPTAKQRLQRLLRKYPAQYYLSGIGLLTAGLVAWLVLLLVGSGTASVTLIALAVAALLLPCSQAAVELMNYLTACVVPPQSLPKLDFSEGIPDQCSALVVVPTLLFNEKQVRNLVENLEVHYLANRDRNLHFALLTDLPDAVTPPEENDPLVHLCAELVEELNAKYSGQKSGSFFLLHRHRVFNPFEEAWMGWERKRGKLLDLNKLLRSEYDSFPVKTGDVALLGNVRYVITLDSDTELPRRAAQRMIGTLAHPLNQAIIDPVKNIVTAGYGILQPRVGVSVNSATSSRFASIYSGQTGLDPYTRAISDVYQDLFGEGIFAGKGIYEIDPFHQVLAHRFPSNSLLSHDLIEGAYTRAG
jgi:hypothetical protein